MAYEGGLSAPHHVVIEERKSLTVSGVEDVERFDENTIVLSTSKGAMVVTGENLHIEKLSLDGGDLKVEGDIDAVTYEDEVGGRGGFFSRLLRWPLFWTCCSGWGPRRRWSCLPSCGTTGRCASIMGWLSCWGAGPISLR